MAKPIEFIPKPEGAITAVVVPLSSTAEDGKASVYAVRKADGTNLLSVNAATSSITLTTLGAPLLLPVYADDTARDAAIPTPARGMLIYNHTFTSLQIHDGGTWVTLATA